MKILLIEDHPDKRANLKAFITSKVEGNLSITDKESLRGSLREVVNNQNYDLILLDMSMPNFDSSTECPGDSSPESFAGKELLEQMALRNIHIPVVIITQYELFEGGTISLDCLSGQIASNYGDRYLGAIYYNSSSDEWKTKLARILDKFHE